MGDLAVGAAVGVRDKEMRRVESALEAGADCVVVDIAHGDSHLEIEMIKNIRRHFPECANRRRKCRDRRWYEAFDRCGRGCCQGGCRAGVNLHHA